MGVIRSVAMGLTVLALVVSPDHARAEDDDDWGAESGWDDLDDPGKANKADEELPPMVMAPETLPAGYVGLRGSAGVVFVF